MIAKIVPKTQGDTLTMQNLPKKLAFQQDTALLELLRDPADSSDPRSFQVVQRGEKWFLFMPCGGSETQVLLSPKGKNQTLQTAHVRHPQCPPIFDLSPLSDGIYHALMLSCGMGGTVEFSIRTAKAYRSKGKMGKK